MLCRICGREVHILIRSGTGICCNICEKIEKGEIAGDDAWKFILEVNPDLYWKLKRETLA